MRRLLIFVVVFGATLLAGWGIAYHLLPQNYTATAQIQILSRGVIDVPGISSFDSDWEANWEKEKTKTLQSMRDPAILLPVIHDLGLDRAWAKRIDPSKGDRLPDLEALDHLNKILKLEVVRGTNLVNINVTDDVPMEAAHIANAIAELYKTMRDVEEDARTQRGLSTLGDQIAEQQKVVERAKADLEKQRQDLESKLTPEELNQAGSKREAFRTALLKSEQEQALLEALRRRLKEDIADSKLDHSPVRIVARAEAPTAADHPVAPIVTFVVATLLGLVASFGEKRFRFF